MQPKDSPVGLPNTEFSQPLTNVRRAATLTERLCGLYVMVTMNLDFSLIKYLIRSGELKSWIKQCLNEPQTCTDGQQS